LRAVHANLYAGNGFGFSTGRAFNGIQLFSPVKRLEVELLDMTTPHGMRRIKVTDFKGSTGRLPRVQIIKNRQTSHFNTWDFKIKQDSDCIERFFTKR